MVLTGYARLDASATEELKKCQLSYTNLDPFTTNGNLCFRFLEYKLVRQVV